MKTSRAAFLIPLLFACGGPEPSFDVTDDELASPTTLPFQTQNVHVPQIAYGTIVFPAGVCTEIYTTKCDGTAKDDTLLLLLDGEEVIGFDDNGGDNGCSRIRYRPTRQHRVEWEIWRKPSSFDPTRSNTRGLVDVRSRRLGTTCPLVAAQATTGSIRGLRARGNYTAPQPTTGGNVIDEPRDDSRLLKRNAAVTGNAVRGFAMHSGTSITTARHSNEYLGSVHPRMVLLTSAVGPVEDYDTNSGGASCPTCTLVQAKHRGADRPSVRTGVVMLGTRFSSVGHVDLRFTGKRLLASVSATQQPTTHIYGPFDVSAASSFVAELSYATAYPVGEPRGGSSSLMGFVRYPATAAAHRMLVAHLERCTNAACSTALRVDSTERFRGHFGGVNVVSPIFLASPHGSGRYQIVVQSIHRDVDLRGTAKIWDRATTSHVTTIGSWNLFEDEDNLDCSDPTAPLAEVWTRYRNDIDLMALQEVEYQCYFDLLNERSNQLSNKAWEFFYTRGDTASEACTDDYVGIIANQRVWPDPTGTSLASRGRGLEFGNARVSVAGDHLDCWSAGENSMLCNSKRWVEGRDPISAGHGLGCQMQPDYDYWNEYPHAMTQRIADIDGNEIIVVSTHQIDISSGDSATNGGPFSHHKTYDEDLGTLIRGLYGPTDENTRIMYLGDLNMVEDALEWEDMVRRLRNAFGYAIDTRLIQAPTPLPTMAGSGSDCSGLGSGGKNDAVVLIGRGWAKLDPAVSEGVVTEEWSASQGGSIEYRADVGDGCVAACSGRPEDGCVNRGNPVVATDHKLLITKVRTAF